MMDKLQDILTKHYSIKPTNITLLREMIGIVYKIDTTTTSYVFKIYKYSEKEMVKRIIYVMNQLKTSTISIPIIHQTNDHKYYVCFHDQIDYIGLLFEYIKGTPPQKNTHISQIANMLSSLHKNMDQVPNLNKYTLGQQFYVGRFIDLLKEKQYNKEKISKLEKIGDELFRVFHQYPLSFCHGDFHNENMIVSNNQSIYLIDFDSANYTNNIIDIATFCDQFDFNIYDEDDFFKTTIAIQHFMSHYQQASNQKIPIHDMMAFIPIRHMELIATIGLVKGIHTITDAFIDQQYHWIISYYNKLKQATF